MYRIEQVIVVIRFQICIFDILNTAGFKPYTQVEAL